MTLKYTLHKQLLMIMKNSGMLYQDTSRFNEELGKTKGLVISSGKCMPPAGVYKHFDAH